MAASPLRVLPLINSTIPAGGVAVVAAFGGVEGGLIVNGSTAADQGIAVVEELYYDLTGPAATKETATTFVLEPGYSLIIPSGTAGAIWVNAKTSGHKFSGVIYQPPTQYPPGDVGQTFPPAASGNLQTAIASYLYEQYRDDSDLQASRNAYNEQMQEYVDWFNQFPLSVYTNPNIAGSLLNWVAYGLYGILRPVLASGRNPDQGPYNTFNYNELAMNDLVSVGPSNVTVTTDDIFKRILTWRLYRGDGKVFNLTWLKRRIKRFLYGTNGTDVVIDNTYEISAFYQANHQIAIVLPSIANATELKQAIDSGALDLPFQYTYSVTIVS